MQRLRRGLPVLGILLAIPIGALFGLGTALLVLAATALLSAISTIWASLQWIAGDAVETSDDVISVALPGSEHEQKQAVLRALKDLEYERSVGKISEQDYEELRQRYRAKARAVLQNLDRELEPTRQEAEKVAAAFLRSKGIEPAAPEASIESAPASADAEASTPEPDKPKDEVPRAEARGRKCPACSAGNDGDAAFCKKCGRRLEESPRAEAGAEP